MAPIQRRELFLQLIGRDLRTRYLGSFSGFAWAVIYPASLLAVYAWVFGELLGARAPDGVSFAAFLALGLWPWLAVAESLNRATTAIVENAGLIGKIALPSWLLVVSSASATFLIHLLGFTIALALLAVTGTTLDAGGLAQLLWIAPSLYAGLIGLSLLLAALNVFIRDLQHALGPILTLGFFLTPIVYPRRALPADMAWLGELNPMASAVDAIRQALLHGAPPGRDDVVLVVLAALLLLAVGAAVFARLRRHFEDFL
jgi:lipopolysaccharide transport system permease protein